MKFEVSRQIFEKKKNIQISVTFIVSPCIFVHLVFLPTYALIFINKMLSQSVTLVALFTPTCFDSYGSSSGSTAGPC